jgi:putative membrane protein
MAAQDDQPGAEDGRDGVMLPGAEPSCGIDRTAAVRDHLANERTLLAWQRTALAMVGLGFVVDRFAFEGTLERSLAGMLLGLGLILAGALAAVVGVYRFGQVERQIDTDAYRPSLGVHVLFAGFIVVGAVGLVLYLLAAGPG